MTAEPEWTLVPGDTIVRSDLHDDYGGGRRGGISPCKKSHNVLVFSDPASGHQHGYRDRWCADGLFDYTGEGQVGDQTFDKGNKAIRDYIKDERPLRVFDGTGGVIVYVGEFAYEEFYFADAPATGGGTQRQVIVFRLRPLDSVAPDVETETSETGPRSVGLEQHLATESTQRKNRENVEATRREQPLVLAYAAHLESLGHDVSRREYFPEPEGRALYCDLFDHTTGTLIESKSSVTREAIRMAIGQLLDYSRLETKRHSLAVLTPSTPRADIVDLLRSLGIGIIHPESTGWVVLPGEVTR